MQGFRHNHWPPSEREAFQSTDPSSSARSKRELIHELDEAKRGRQDSEAREKRVKEELEKAKAMLESVETTFK
jgi:hypothetical protein